MNWPLSFRRPFDLHEMNGFDVTTFTISSVAFKFRCGRQINARVGAEFRGGFFLAVIEIVSLRPFRPRIIFRTFKRRFW